MKNILSLFIISFALVACSKPKIEEVVVMTPQAEVKYSMEIAQTERQMEKGLMNRKTLAPDSGMLFDLTPPRRTAMWMKDTLISLDMLFIAEDGKIVCIQENAEPKSEFIIACPEVVRAVLEVNAGDVKKHKIKVGDKIKHPVFTKK